ncbi:MAG: 2Fe-2S iron-sulfur cluster-binding protein, partial [Ghiorsea sp.]|nr:2Fe-2S iron-sulfur cluster-binding protein [Ghiorsea sp.]
MNTVKLDIYRFNPETDDKPSMQSFEVPIEKPGMKLLDALNYIKWHLDGSLTYRRS